MGMSHEGVTQEWILPFVIGILAPDDTPNLSTIPW